MPDPGVHPPCPIGDHARSLRPFGVDPAVQGALGVQDHRPAAVRPLESGPGIGQRVREQHDRRVLEVLPGDRGDGQALEPAVGADEVCDEGTGRRAQDRRRVGVLLQDAALAQHGDPVTEAHRLLDVVGDEDDRLAHLGLQPQELLLQPSPGDRVDRAERLVHQQHRRVGGQRPGDPDPLALAPGQLVRIAPPVHRRVEAHQVEQLVDPRRGAPAVPADQTGYDGDVGRHRLVREQPDLLDDVADPAAQLHRVAVGDVLAAQHDPAAGGLDQPVDHLHRGRLAAPGRADQDAQLTLPDLQVERVDDGLAGVGLGQPLKSDHRRASVQA